jgi:ArsR family transcriptional regulator
MKDLARIFRALADETRLQMLALILHEGELCVCDCMQVLDIGQSKASRHLRYLANVGLLDDRRQGAWVYYRVSSGLDAGRGVVVDAVQRLLPRERIEELLEQLDDWKRRKRVREVPIV